jgi:hypothetical protein
MCRFFQITLNHITLENVMGEQEKMPERLFLTELRLCGESNHWRVDVRYTATLNDDDESESSDKKSGNDEKKSSAPQEVKLSILVPAGDRSVVDLQIDAMDRAVMLLQATANAARAEQAKRWNSGEAMT